MQFTPERMPPIEKEANFSSQNRSFLWLLGAAVVVMLVAIGLAVSLILPDTDEQVRTTTTTTTTTTAPAVPAGQAPNSDSDPAPLTTTSTTPTSGSADSWRSDVIVYETPEATTSPNSEPAREESAEREPPPLLWTNEPPIKIEPTPYDPPAQREQAVAPDSVPEPETQPPSLPTIADRSYQDCGTLTIPTGAGLLTFTFSASREPAVVCLGESIGASCGNHAAIIEADGTDDFEVLVTEKPNGVCAVGAKLDPDTVLLCSVEELMDRGVGPDKTESEWQAEFQADPGGTFVEMYVGNQTVFDELRPDARYGCEEFRVD